MTRKTMGTDGTVHRNGPTRSRKNLNWGQFRPSPLVGCIALASALFAQADNSARDALIKALNQRGFEQLAQRERAIAAVQMKADAMQRQANTKKKLLSLIGDLPVRMGNPVVRAYGEISGDGFRIEKLAYQSLPGMWVTANVYVPTTGAGPFPAVLLSPGHEANGKQGQYSWGVNFAKSGILAMAIDPLGQGERLQYYDEARKASAIGGSTGEHGEANLAPLLVGENIARYFVNDAIRGIDYLETRSDVAKDKIGAFGCSGGGTVTAYLTAFDERVKAAAVACYLTSFKELLTSATGVQEAEQSIPHFLEQGFDFADWAELAAPRPYAIVATTEDMFPFEGAKQTYNEVARFYGLFGARSNLEWFTGPGGHGNLGPVSGKILGFFLHHLAGALAGEAKFTAVRSTNPSELLCSPTGQIGGVTLPTVFRARAASAKRTPTRDEVLKLLGPPIDAGLPSRMYEPDRASGAPVVVIGASPEQVDSLKKEGRKLAMVDLRPTPVGTESIKSPYLGPFNLLGLRASLVGTTLVGIQLADVTKAVNQLAASSTGRVEIHGYGAGGAVALYAAFLDPRIASVTVEDSLASYRSVLDREMPRDIPPVLVPGALAQFDLPDLVAAIAPRPVRVVNPK